MIDCFIDSFQIECTGCGPNEKGRDYKKRDFYKNYMNSVGYDEMVYLGGDFIYKRRKIL